MKNTNIYLNWYYDVKNHGVDTLYVKIKSKKEILELQNFFLVCQRFNQEGIKHKFNLNITCSEADEFRIKNYLYMYALTISCIKVGMILDIIEECLYL